VARVLISEPHEDIRWLLALVVSRLGHESVFHAPDEPLADDLHVDAAILEPGAPAALELAAGLAERDVVLLFTSIYPAEDEALAFHPAAYLVKPFPLYTLERALRDALAVPLART
jgi:hypothetical protein